MTIEEYMKTKQNNFDFIRLFAAVLVIFSHSYPLTLGSDEYELLFRLTKGELTFGNLAVYIFFIVSGFLITMSFDKTKDVIYYSKSRIIRIFPALIFVVLLTTFIIGPLVTTLSVKSYFSQYETYNYLKMISLTVWVDKLPGVFVGNELQSVNGSLWTLGFEVAFYIVVGLLGILKSLNKIVIFTLFYLSLVLSFFGPPSWLNYGEYFGVTFDYQLVNLFRFFSAGMLIYLFRDKIIINKSFAIFSLAMLITSYLMGQFILGFLFFGSYLLFYFAFVPIKKISNINKFGDFSYGLYIYAFPIQQTVSYLYDISPFLNFVISLPLTLLCAFISWHLVEKRFMKLKNKKFIKINLNGERKIAA